MRYRKKPIIIEAHQWPNEWGWPSHWPPVPVRLAEDGAGDYLVVTTLEGQMIARPGDYIVWGTHGEFYPVKRQIFEANYEAIDPAARICSACGAQFQPEPRPAGKRGPDIKRCEECRSSSTQRTREWRHRQRVESGRGE